MKTKAAKSIIFGLLVKILRLGGKLRWALLEKRLKWQRRTFYDSLELYEIIHLTHSISPFLKTVELDAVIFAFKGQVAELRRCLSQGVSINLRGLMENTIYRGNVQVVELLLSGGANPNRAIDGMGNTCLHEATSRGQPAIVELLLAKGADPNRKTLNGKKPLYYAYDRASGHAPLIKLLEPVTQLDHITYHVDDFLKMDDPIKAYSSLCAAIREGFRHHTAGELRVLSLSKFMWRCWPSGFEVLYREGPWAIMPCAELMEAIDEPVFAGMLRQCITILREFGQQVGRDPFTDDEGALTLDDVTEENFNAPDLAFHRHDFDEAALCRKTMDYVRMNRALFEP